MFDQNIDQTVDQMFYLLIPQKWLWEEDAIT